MRPPLRIAILETDTPLDKTRAQYGGYGGVFRQLLENSAEALGDPGLGGKSGLKLAAFNVEKGENYPSLEDYDAILLTGSRYNSFDNDPWIIKLVEYVQKALDDGRVRVIGICFGHQIVGRALGQKVGRGDKGWEISVTPIELTGEGKRLFRRDKLDIFQMHRDIVYDFPKRVEALGRTEVCQNQGMYQKGRLITVQGHPEFTRDIVEEIIQSRYEKGIFTEEMRKDAVRRLEDHDDGVIVGQAILRFLLED